MQNLELYLVTALFLFICLFIYPFPKSAPTYNGFLCFFISKILLIEGYMGYPNAKTIQKKGKTGKNHPNKIVPKHKNPKPELI